MPCDYTGAASEDPPARKITASTFTLDTGPVTAAPLDRPSTLTSTPPLLAPNPIPLFPSPPSLFAPTPAPLPPTPSPPITFQPPSSSNLDLHLLCTVDATRVRDRWLEGWVPHPGQHPKDLSRNTAHFIHTILKSYPQSLCKGGLPPLVHGLQKTDGRFPAPLENCVSIARMWDGQEGGGSAMVRETTRREMERLDAEVCRRVMGV